MRFLDLLDHLANFLAPAVGIAAIAAALAKLIWRNTLRPVPWWRLAAWGAVAAGIMTIVGLVLFGRDGRMATYVGMAAANAVALWWKGFGRRRA